MEIFSDSRRLRLSRNPFGEVWRARRPSKMKSYRTALPGGRGVCAPWAQTFLKILAEKAGAAGLFRHAEAARDGIFSASRRSF